MFKKQDLRSVNVCWCAFSPMGPCQGMSDSVRAAEALMTDKVVLTQGSKNKLDSVETRGVWELTNLHW